MQKYLQTTLPIEISSKTLLNNTIKRKDYIIYNGRLIWANPNIYLKGDGNSYIVTNYIPSNAMVVNMKYGNIDNWLFASRRVVSAVSFGFSKTYVNYATESFSFNSPTSGIIEYGQTVKINGETIHTFSDSLFYENAKLVLYTIRNESDGQTYTKSLSKIYYLQIYEADSLLYHFVPVPQGLEIGNFTIPSNGMFDIVNQQFYNNSGQGSFIYGKDI